MLNAQFDKFFSVHDWNIAFIDNIAFHKREAAEEAQAREARRKEIEKSFRLALSIKGEYEYSFNPKDGTPTQHRTIDACTFLGDYVPFSVVKCAMKDWSTGEHEKAAIQFQLALDEAFEKAVEELVEMEKPQ